MSAHYVGYEISPQYIELARRRIAQDLYEQQRWAKRQDGNAGSEQPAKKAKAIDLFPEK